MSKDKSSLTIIFLGPAGSGKGTQADLLVDKFNLQKIEAGELVRAKAKEKTNIGIIVKRIHESGQQLADELVISLLKEAFKKLNSRQGLVLDGYPRTLGQAYVLEKMLRGRKRGRVQALWIKVGDREAMRRLLTRSVCQVCKKVFIGRQQKSCPECGGKIEVRDYDTKESIKKRLEWFHKKVKPVIKYYKRRGELIEIDGEGSVEEVHREIVAKLTAKLSLLRGEAPKQ